MKKFLYLLVVLALLVPSVVFADDPVFPRDGEVTCERAWASITNDSNTTLPYTRRLRAKANGISIPTGLEDEVWLSAAPGETVEVSWNPPDGFVGKVDVNIRFDIRPVPYNQITADLDCPLEPTPDPVLPVTTTCEKVFYWTDGFCAIRQRGGPIGGQGRPFRPMQNAYCGSDYAHDDGWVGVEVSSCREPQNYEYWNELPLFHGLMEF